MSHHYRITQTFEVAVDDESAFLEWACQIVDFPENPQTQVIVGLGRIVRQSLRGAPGIWPRDAHGSVRPFEPAEE